MSLCFDNDRVGMWMHSLGASEYRTGMQCIGLEKDGEIVAATAYDFCNGKSIYTHIAINGPVTKEWLRVIFEYPFQQLGCDVLIGLVSEANEKCRSLVKHMGFRLQCWIPDADPSGALLIFTMRRKQCKYLKENHGKTLCPARA